MSENKRNIDELFLQELGNATEAPPSSVWERLEQRLDRQSGRKMIGWWFYLLIVLLFVGGSIAAYIANERNKSLQTEQGPAAPVPRIPNSTGSHSPDTSSSLQPGGPEEKMNIAASIDINPELRRDVHKGEQADAAAATKSGKSRPVRAQNGGAAPVDAAANTGKPRTSPASGNDDVLQTDNAPATGKNRRTRKAPEPVPGTSVPAKEQTKGDIAASDKGTGKKSDQPAAGIAPNGTGIQSGSRQKELLAIAEENAKTGTRKPAPPADKNMLSGVPSDEKESYDEPDEESSKLSDIFTMEPAAKSKTSPLHNAARQQEKIEQARAANPLAGAPIAEAVVEETISEPGEQATPGESSSGGGGGGAAQAKEKNRRPLNMLIGIKGGYETGPKSYTANKFIATIFGEVNFSRKLSFIMQPGIKFANTNREYRAVAGTYVRVDSTLGSLYNLGRDSMGKLTGYNDYTYRQSYDSIVSSIIAQKKFLEIEIPFLFRYKIDKHLSVMAGMNFTFGKIIGLESMLKTFSGLSLTDTLRGHFDPSGSVPDPASKFSHPGSVPFSSYKDPAVTDPISPVRFGYTLGLSYTAKQRLMIDLTIQQNLSGLTNIKDREVKKLFVQPYVRLTLGYVLLGNRK